MNNAINEEVRSAQYPLVFQRVYLKKALAVIKALDDLPRTGWVDRGVENPETVGEHTEALIDLAEIYFHVPGLTVMLKIHDWPESNPKVGDRRTDSNCPTEKRRDKEEKKRDETAAMREICISLGPEGRRLFKTWNEYEEQKTRRSRIASQIDKFQVIIKAIEYETSGEPVIAQEFIDEHLAKIKNQLLRKLLRQAIKSLA